MTAPSNHHPADDAERISSICSACMIDRRRHHAHAAAAHGPLRARRAGGRRLSRMRHWKGHVPCSAVGAGECGGWHTTTARAVCARRRPQESAARRLSLHGPCWGSGGLAQAPENRFKFKIPQFRPHKRIRRPQVACSWYYNHAHWPTTPIITWSWLVISLLLGA